MPLKLFTRLVQRPISIRKSNVFFCLHMWSLVIDCSSILSIAFYSIKYTKYCIKSQYIFLFSQLIHIVKHITWEDSSGFLGFFFKYLTNYINTESFPIPVISSKEYKKNAVLLKHRNGTKNPKRSPICTPPPPQQKHFKIMNISQMHA